MNIKVYGLKGCNQCKAFCKFLANNNISYEYIDNEDMTLAIGEKNNILSVPIIDIDDKIYDSRSAITYVSSQCDF
jgi:glutaredoxin